MNKLAELNETIEQVKSEIKVNQNGCGNFSVRALSRLADVHHSTLQQHFGGGVNPSRLAKTLMDKGFEIGGFSVNGVPDTAAFLVLDYYAHDAGKNCTEFAKQTLKAIGAIGMRQWCREVTGWTKENSEAVVVDTMTAESMFSTMMEMKQQMSDILQVAQRQVNVLTAEVEHQKLLVAEKQETINDMVEKENIRDEKFQRYPGLKEATDFALNWDEEEDEEIFFTLKDFCQINTIRLTRGQKIQVGKLATDFCRLAVMRKLPKNVVGHTLYSSRFEPIVKLAIMEVLHLVNN